MQKSGSCASLVESEKIKYCKMKFNEYLFAKIGFDAAENEPFKILDEISKIIFSERNS